MTSGDICEMRSDLALMQPSFNRLRLINMDIGAAVAMTTTGIALGSLTVSILQANVGRQHNRYSVRPLLELTIHKNLGGNTGVGITNYGLGPAIIKSVNHGIDGGPAREWTRASLFEVRDSLTPSPGRIRYSIPKEDRALPVGFEALWLYVEEYDSKRHVEFWNWINGRMWLEICYESLYGERFRVKLAECVGEGP